MALPKVPGVKIEMGGTTWVVPPLTLAQLEQHQKALAEFQNSRLDAVAVGTVIDVTHAALTRNYPEITREEVANLIDVSTMVDVMESVMDVSGLKRKAQEASGKL